MLAGWFKQESFRAEELYQLNSPGSIAGEGAAMFFINGKPAGAIAQVQAVGTIHTDDTGLVAGQLKSFIDKNLPDGEKIDLLVSGEDGDSPTVEIL